MTIKSLPMCSLAAILCAGCDSRSVESQKPADGTNAFANYLERVEVWDKLGDHPGRYQLVLSAPPNLVIFDTSSGRVFAATNGHWQMILDLPDQPPAQPKTLFP